MEDKLPPTDKLAITDALKSVFEDLKVYFAANISQMHAEYVIDMQKTHAPLLKKLNDIEQAVENIYGEIEELKNTLKTMNKVIVQYPQVPGNMPGVLIKESPPDDMFKTNMVEEFTAD